MPSTASGLWDLVLGVGLNVFGEGARRTDSESAITVSVRTSPADLLYRVRLFASLLMDRSPRP